MNSFAKQPVLQFALRELNTMVRRPRLWMVFAIVCAIFAITGPFGTFDALNFPARLGYWAIIQSLTWAIALTVIALCGAVLQKPAFSNITTVLVGALLAAVPIGIVVEALTAYLFDRPITLPNVVWQIALSAPISMLLGLLAILFLQGSQEGAQAPVHAPKSSERFLRRLPVEKRGPLLYLTMQDHYVEAVTNKGSALILLRFQEAMDELAEYDGLQIHRSHWVALDAVETWRREGGKLLVEMRGGAVLPVSRSFAKPVREILSARFPPS